MKGVILRYSKHERLAFARILRVPQYDTLWFYNVTTLG
jgi:hypothetical protein